MQARIITTSAGFEYDAYVLAAPLGKVQLDATYDTTGDPAERSWADGQLAVLESILRHRANGRHAQAPGLDDGRHVCVCGLVLPLGTRPDQHPGHLKLDKFVRANVIVVVLGRDRSAYCQLCGWTQPGTAELSAKGHAAQHRCAALEELTDLTVSAGLERLGATLVDGAEAPPAGPRSIAALASRVDAGELTLAEAGELVDVQLPPLDPENRLDPRHPDWNPGW